MIRRLAHLLRPCIRGAAGGVLVLALAGCAYTSSDGYFVSPRYGFKIRPVPADPWRATPDVANILALNDPSTSVLYYDNPHSGGVISLQVLPRHYDASAPFTDELTYIYRRMLGTPHDDMRTVVGGKFTSFGDAIRITRHDGIQRAEFLLAGTMGRRPTARARELARERLEASQPFAGPRTGEELKEQRKFRYESLTPEYTGNYRGKVVVFLRNGTLYEFYYIDNTLTYDSGVRVFDAFVGSLKFLTGFLGLGG